jgi:hypothetical protein
MPRGGFPTPFDGGLPLRKVNNPRTPGRGKGPRGETMNPEANKRAVFNKQRKAASGHTKRPAVGK